MCCGVCAVVPFSFFLRNETVFSSDGHPNADHTTVNRHNTREKHKENKKHKHVKPTDPNQRRARVKTFNARLLFGRIPIVDPGRCLVLLTRTADESHLRFATLHSASSNRDRIYISSPPSPWVVRLLFPIFLLLILCALVLVSMASHSGAP